MKLPCGHDEQPLPGQPLIEGGCRMCWRYVNDDKFRQNVDIAIERIAKKELLRENLPKPKGCGCKRKKKDG